MNIFVTDPNPMLSAIVLDDRRLNKMIVESMQMLATVLIGLNAPSESVPIRKDGQLYKPTHKNHPCTVWVGKTNSNFMWLVFHVQSLLQEYERRFGKTHGCEASIDRVLRGQTFLPNGFRTPFVNVSYFNSDDVCSDYRATLAKKWSLDTTARWTNAMPPAWRYSYGYYNGDQR